MNGHNGRRPSLYDLLTAAAVVLNGAALLVTSATLKLLGILLAIIALVIIAATHAHEFAEAVKARRPTWRLLAVVSIALISLIALLIVLPSLPSSPALRPSEQAPAPIPVSAPSSARRLPTADDFTIVAVSPRTIAPGGTFTLLLKDRHSPARPARCKALPPTNLASFFSTDWGGCDDVILRSTGGPIPRAADGRTQTTGPTSFSPRIIVQFAGGEPDLVVAGLENGEPLSINNLVPLETGPKSRLVLSMSQPLRADIRLTTGAMPSGFTCEWSDELDAVWNVVRRKLSPDGCDYEIALVDGPETRQSLADRRAVGQLASRLVDAFGISLALVVKADDEVYTRSIVKGQVRP